jgi:protein-tyrosine phosphatase
MISDDLFFTKPRLISAVAFALALVADLAAAPLVQKSPPTPAEDAAQALLVWDVAPELRDALPRNFRTTDQPLVVKDGRAPSSAGLTTLHESGGAEFTPAGLKLMLAKMQGPVTIFDLRQETHVFADGVPVSWFATNNWANVNRTHEAIEADEAARVKAWPAGTTLALADDKGKKGTEGATPPEKFTVTQATTERSLVEAAGAHYVRLTVTDHARPLDGEVDRFILAVRAMPADGWAHFHCRAGRGRTTTFMALYDMLRNAREVSIEDIARRQEVLGNDYDVLRPAEPGSWKAPITADRIAFIRAFYEYAKANPGGRPQLWSEWLKAQPATE